eukprot:768738-Hanusia_phi.AAC.1
MLETSKLPFKQSHLCHKKENAHVAYQVLRKSQGRNRKIVEFAVSQQERERRQHGSEEQGKSKRKEII